MLDSKTLSQTARALAQDAALAEVAAALEAAGVEPLLIRGPVVARWLYDSQDERPYQDVDLLVDPNLYAGAERVLAGLGFVDTSEGMRSHELHPNESHWVRVRESRVTVDLHHSLALIGLPAELAWTKLRHDATPLVVAGVPIDVPAPATHLVLLALHAAHHGVEYPKPRADLRRALARVDRATWVDAAAMATELGSAGAMREGLKLIDGGRELADELGLPDNATRIVRLHARTPPPTSSGIENLLHTHGLRPRISLVVGRFFPSRAYIKQWKPLARRGRSGLVLAYLWRPFWLLWHAPGGAAAWFSAALPRERRARFPAFVAGARWALRAWWRCRAQLRHGGLEAVALPAPPDDFPGAENGVRRALAVVPASCLESSLVRQLWYASHGRPRDVVIGVRGPAKDFGAHAWLDGDPEQPGLFVELKRWPAPVNEPAASPIAVLEPAAAVFGDAATPVAPQLDPASLGDVAIVHDYLNQRGGAEKVVLELAELWPDAPIYTSLYRSGSTFGGFSEHDVRTSPLNRLPVDKRFRALFPLYPAAFRSFGEIDGDVVISSSSGWAHMVRTTPRALHVVYCYTPARWLYRGDYLGGGGRADWRQTAVLPIASRMRRRDQRAARSADLYIAISGEVRKRIRNIYGLDAEVVYPPVDIDRFVPRPRGERLLVIARLLPYKRVDLVIRAAARLGLGLDVVGTGPMIDVLRGIAGPDVTFHGAAPGETVTELLESARAVCVAAEEDFGIVPVEAQAAGKPVVAYARGGALETVTAGVTGVFFDEQTEDSIVAAIRASEDIDTAPEVIAEHAQPFAREAFRRNLVAVIAAHLESR